MVKPAVKKTNWFAIWTSIGVVVAVVAIAVVVVFSNQAANKLPAENIPAAVDTETGAVTIGNGEDTVSVFVDFMCPNCKNFETNFGGDLRDLAKSDNISLGIHAVSILDKASKGTKYSTRAANAFYCVAEEKPELTMSYMDALFAKQPAEGTTGLSDERLIELASGLGVDIKACQTDQTFADFVTKQTRNNLPRNPQDQGLYTPTVLVNDEYTQLSTLTPTFFTDMFGGAAKSE